MINELDERDIVQLLKDKLPDFEISGTPVLLTGGNLNFVWRLPGKPNSVIIKHAPPYIASNPGLPLSQDRIKFEAMALQLFEKNAELESLASALVRPPELYHFDRKLSVIVMEDLHGFSAIDDITLQESSCKKIGRNLGVFIGLLHKKTYGALSIGEKFNNHLIQQTRFQVQYEPTHQYADISEVDSNELKKIEKKTKSLGKELMEPGKCLVMGDLWQRSVLVNNELQIRLIDWEFVHFGRPLQDVAHFASHCIMHQQAVKTECKTNIWKILWSSFWNAYKQSMGSHFNLLFDKEEIRNFHVHLGAEILIRANGPFQKGYIFEDTNVECSEGRQIIRLAADYILENENCNLI